MAMLKRSCNNSKAGEVLRDEMGKLLWGMPKRYMRKRMLLAFVQKMGHEYESILDGAIEEKRKAEVIETALVAANHQIALAIEGNDEGKNIENDKNERQDWCDESFGVRVSHSIGQYNRLCTKPSIVPQLKSTQDKRLMINLMCFCQFCERCEIMKVKWIDGSTSPADAMTEASHVRHFRIWLISTPSNNVHNYCRNFNAYSRVLVKED